MFEFGGELAAQLQESAPALVPVGEQVYRELNQSAIQTFFNGAEQIIRWLMGIGVLVSIGFCIWGFILLNRAADNPQMWAKARNQIVLSIAAAAGCTLAFFFIGAGIEFVTGASGGAAVDVGNVGIAKQETGEIRLEGDFLGLYNGEVILCDDTVATTTVVDGNAVWGWTAGAAGDADDNDDTGQCDRK